MNDSKQKTNNLRFLSCVKFVIRPIYQTFCHTTACGRKRGVKPTPAILTGNHLSMMDIFSHSLFYPHNVYSLGKKELTGNKFVGCLLGKLGLIPVERGNADLASLRQIMKVLKGGTGVAIYPEGTRNKQDNRLCRTHGGAAMLAIKTKSAVVPFASNRAARFGQRNFCVFGDPYELSDFYSARLNAEVLESADSVVRSKLIQVKRIADYLASLKQKQRRFLINLLNNDKIPFQMIYDAFEPQFLPCEFSVAPQEPITAEERTAQ